MRSRSRAPLAALSLALAVVCPGPTPAADPSPGLPPGERWLEHFRRDLLPFWNLPDAFGSPRGSFPTWRCDDGRLPDPARPCAELRDLPPWMAEGLGRQYVRMVSRQTYFYGVAFHLSGDKAMLELARDGVNFIRAHALDREGSAVTWLKDGRPAGPAVLERTAQDEAYALVGLAMYYDLTRDPQVLRDIVRLKEHVFREYWDEGWGMLRWVVRDSSGAGEEKRQELVAQLDQLNAYLLLVTPLLPEPQRTAWKADLLRLARLLRGQFFAPEQHMYYGTLGTPGSETVEGRHNDFGHSAKALWMTERIALLTGDGELLHFARYEAGQLLRRALLPDGTWASRPAPGGGLDAGKEWWIFAELDELCATLSLSNPVFAPILEKTYAFWLAHMPDPVGHEVFGWVGANGQPGPGPKIHLWKSGYHSAEHALVAYLTTKALRQEPAALYFAFEGEPGAYRPYYFEGEVLRVEPLPARGAGDRPVVKVTFGDLK
ncbi:MAG TPA: hypothetical protein VFG59_18265 [Anaeromyxobacter sp.]|nr:hypothetical protein [Anaeromyxobacter sp.]